MDSSGSSPAPVPATSSPIDSAVPSTTKAEHAASSPVIDDSHSRRHYHHHHGSGRRESSRSPPPVSSSHHREGSRYEGRHELREHAAPSSSDSYYAHQESRYESRHRHPNHHRHHHHAPPPPHEDRYAPRHPPAPPSSSSRYPPSRHDTRRDDYRPSYDSPSRYHDRHAPPPPPLPRHDRRQYDDPYYSRSRPSRRTIDRGTEEDRAKSTTIFVGNLPYAFREQDVAGMFERYGKLVKITIPIDNVTTKNKGFAFVEFEEKSHAQEAYDNYQGFSVEGRRLKLDWDVGLNRKERRKDTTDSYRRDDRRARSSSRSPPRPSNHGHHRHEHPSRNERHTGDSYIPSKDSEPSRRTADADRYRH